MILLLKFFVCLRCSLFWLKSVLVNMLIRHYQSIGLLNPTTDFLVSGYFIPYLYDPETLEYGSETAHICTYRHDFSFLNRPTTTTCTATAQLNIVSKNVQNVVAGLCFFASGLHLSTLPDRECGIYYHSTTFWLTCCNINV